MNSLQIKNWLAQIKTNVDNKRDAFDNDKTPLLSFIQELELFIINIEEMSKHIEVLDQKIEEIEEFISKPTKKTPKSKAVENGYMQTILVKISILKNIIKQDMGTDDTLLSSHLTVVESIENEIKTTKKVTRDQLEQLNMIYDKQRIAGKI